MGRAMSVVAESSSRLQPEGNASFSVWPRQLPDGFAANAPHIRRSGSYEVAKGVSDLVIASILLILATVPLAIAAIAIKLSSPGPILYSQVRCGRGGEPFRCWKLRTMVTGAENYLAETPELRDSFEKIWKVHGDPRVTRVGTLLRRTSLDEVPQFWNVLLGQMSLVGPRPVVRDELISMYGEAASTVVSVKPGLTGLWQVRGRSALSYPERVSLDLLYVERRSAMFDLLILLRTPGAVVSGRGAV
jgi:exopolysaccharide production protein ExoY